MEYIKIYMLIGILLLPFNIKCYLVNEDLNLKDTKMDSWFIWIFFIPLWIFNIKETFKGGDPSYKDRMRKLETEKRESKIRWKKRRGKK
jgi:hypothetical protein